VTGMNPDYCAFEKIAVFFENLDANGGVVLLGAGELATEKAI
jgi:hypothetical protein